MPLDNDTRGWIMTIVSGLACILGASIICVDIIVRLFPGKKDFDISESNTFLSASLSLSFGVMLFSALYSMLPEAKSYLTEGDFSKQEASWILIGLFLGGVIGIQVLSQFLHHFMPSHVVDCDHSHDEEALEGDMEDSHHHDHTRSTSNPEHGTAKHHDSREGSDEETPLLSRDRSRSPLKPGQTRAQRPEMAETPSDGFSTAPQGRRPSFVPRTLTRTISALAAGHKSACDETGPCKGYSDPCGTECFRAVTRRQSANPGLLRQPTYSRGRSTTGPVHFAMPDVLEEDSNNDNNEPHSSTRSHLKPNGVSRTASYSSVSHPSPLSRSRSATHHYHHPPHENGHENGDKKRRASSTFSMGADSHANSQAQHHHHVPSNAFMAIGLQTSIAIALHKLPEGFITYATNHANPTLGFTVFMALFIHNITEGFAMALPLYLALNSRLKAIVWSTILGGASQPLGAGIAALWFKIAGEGSMKPGDRVYGCMFAVTAGVMTSVALSLFSESLSMTHSKRLCTVFAFLGMGILGVSFALTGGH